MSVVCASVERSVWASVLEWRSSLTKSTSEAVLLQEKFNMGRFLAEMWDMLVGRLSGPMTFRLIIQPLVATVLAVRSGLKDAKAGYSPYLWSVYSDPDSRSERIHPGWKDVRNVFVLAMILDAVDQIIEFRWIYIGQAVIVALILAIVPYVLVRGPFSRIMSTIWKARSRAPCSGS